MNSSQTKARESSVASAKAKASAEKAFRGMVVDNNKTCSACRLGKEKIAKRRLEIDGAIKQETKLKAQREAEKRRQSRGRGGRRSGLAQESPSAPLTPVLTQPMPLNNVQAPPVPIAPTPVEPISVAQETKAPKSHHHERAEQEEEEPAQEQNEESNGEESD